MEKAELEQLDAELNDMMSKWQERNRKWAERLAAEIIAAVEKGEDFPDEWYSVDAYADCGSGCGVGEGRTGADGDSALKGAEQCGFSRSTVSFRSSSMSRGSSFALDLGCTSNG